MRKTTTTSTAANRFTAFGAAAIQELEGRRLMSADVANTPDVAYADFTGDGVVDAADYVMNHVVFGRGNGDGTFTPDGAISVADVPGRVEHVVGGDFNGDGTIDLLTAGTYGRGARAQGIIAILIGLAHDGQTPPQEAFAAPRVTSLLPAIEAQPLVGDWNGDGRDDLGVARPNGIIGILTANLMADGSVHFARAGSVTLGERPAGRVAAGDVNGDGRDDLAYVGARSRSIHFVENRGAGVWDDTDLTYAVTMTDVLISSVIDNGTEDLVAFRNGSAHVFQCIPQGLPLLVGTSPIHLSNKALERAALADVNGDGHTDLFAAAPRGGRRYLALGDGTGAFSETPVPPVSADLLGLIVTTSDIDAQLFAQTGDGQVLGNL